MAAKKSKRSPSGAPATKWFITAASIAAMLGGWVAFSSQPADGVDPATKILEADLGLEPIPTLVPAPASRQNAIRSDDSSSNSQTSLPTLRSVTAPRPAPITVTRSSR